MFDVEHAYTEFFRSLGGEKDTSSPWAFVICSFEHLDWLRTIFCTVHNCLLRMGGADVFEALCIWPNGSNFDSLNTEPQLYTVSLPSCLPAPHIATATSIIESIPPYNIFHIDGSKRLPVSLSAVFPNSRGFPFLARKHLSIQRCKFGNKSMRCFTGKPWIVHLHPPPTNAIYLLEHFA